MNPIVTVTSAATSRKLLDYSYVRDMLNLSTSDISDQKLDSMIDGVSAAVEGWLDRKLIYETVSEQWRFTRPAESIWLTRWPVRLITSITEDDDDALTSSYWEVDYDTGELFRLDGSDHRICWDVLKVTITYSAGYEAADETGGSTIPGDLRDGALEVFKSRWFAIERDPYERSVEIPGLGSVSYGFGPMARNGSASLPPEAEVLLAPYRRASVG